MMDMKARRQAGLPYLCGDDMKAKQGECRRKLALFNSLPIEEAERREALLREIFGSLGSNPWINAPLLCDYGYNIFAGDNVIINYNCVMLDVAPIYIGDNVQIAPNATISTAGHPIHPEKRALQYEFGRSIRIESDVWMGAGVIVNPGVTIGRGAVIGSGSVVTRDIPPMVVAAGSPCRVIRPITEADRYKYYKDEVFDFDPYNGSEQA